MGESEAAQGLVKVKQLKYDAAESEGDHGVSVPLAQLGSFVSALLGPRAAATSQFDETTATQAMIQSPRSLVELSPE